MNGKAPFPVPAFVKTLALAVLLSGAALAYAPADAADLPLAAGSPLAGFSFDDRPLLLPVQRNFQMALLTASSELGRSCGKMEAYGWRMGATEQQRVNQIFSNTVERLRTLGYSVESQSPSSVSSDITLFTADRPDKHFILMWSAGEIGLAMVLCESSAPTSSRLMSQPSVQVFAPPPGDVVSSELQSPPQGSTARSVAHFTPVGDWIGSYTCMQGYTGGTLHIARLDGENFNGTFKFYPTPKNPDVAAGRYEVYGQYDRASQRILINPGKWLERPHGYYNTIIVGSFDPVARTFSAYFQGINGCTSFEAKAGDEDIEALQQVHKTAKKPRRPTRKHAHKKPAPKPAITPTASAPGNAAPLSIVPDQPPANVAAPTPAAPAPAAPVLTAPATPPASAPVTPPAAANPPPAAAAMPAVTPPAAPQGPNPTPAAK